MTRHTEIFMQKALLATGIAIIAFALLSDWMGIGTSGFGFGPGQVAMILIGLTVIAWGIFLRLHHPFKRYAYSLVLSMVLFALWKVWLYPASGYSWNILRPQMLFLRVLIGAQLYMLCSSVGFTIATLSIAWSKLRDPLSRKDFLVGHILWARRINFVSWMLLWIVGALIAAELLSRRLLELPEDLGKRPIQPYLVNGDFYKGLPDNVMLGHEGPGVYGYYQAGGIYLYGFDRQVSSIAERGDFLFQDRVVLANNINNIDAVRIFVIGGSAAYGTGASSKDTRWFVLLEQALSTAFNRQISLIPAAMGAYNSTQERLVLELMVLPRNPDGIIIFDGYNDTAAINRPGDPYNQGALYKQFYSLVFGVQKWLAKHFYLYRYQMNKTLQQAIEKNYQQILENPVVLRNYSQSVASVYLDNVFRMQERLKDRGIPCITFLQPIRALTWRNQGIQTQLSLHDTLALAAYDEILKRIHAASSDPPIYDLTSAFDAPGSAEWFSDPVHFTDPGHRVIAELMYPLCLDVFDDDKTTDKHPKNE